jgi:hypothetical protein
MSCGGECAYIHDKNGRKESELAPFEIIQIIKISSIPHFAINLQVLSLSVK